jgi:GDPmannose 4,6-dehydratase
MMQQPEPDDYVLATGETRSVRDFVDLAFAETGRKIAWEGQGADEKGRDAGTGQLLVEIDPRYFRPTEVDLLLGDATKARQKLGWVPQTSFAQMVTDMVRSDLVVVKDEAARNDRHG